jgi:hypothetical protein
MIVIAIATAALISFVVPLDNVYGIAEAGSVESMSISVPKVVPKYIKKDKL